MEVIVRLPHHYMLLKKMWYIMIFSARFDWDIFHV